MSAEEIIEFEIILRGIRPTIWRTFQTERNITFHQLHSIIQTVMGWGNSHLYAFYVDGKEYQDDTHNDVLFENDARTLPSKKHKIDSLKQKQMFMYVYDFGDSWEHALVVRNILPKQKGVVYPVCVDGKRSSPPEDCGGEPGYAHLLHVQKNKKHKEYEELIVDWLGEDFDAEHFITQEVNHHLRRLFKKKGEKKPDGRARGWILNK